MPHESLHRELATEPLYLSICLESGKSVVSLLHNLIHRPDLGRYIHELIITGPVKENECRSAFAAQKWAWPSERFSDIFPATHTLFAGWESWSKGFPVSEPEGLEPVVAATTMAKLFRATPRLRSLAIKDAFIPHFAAFSKLNMILRRVRRKNMKAHVFPELSTLVILGKNSSEPALMMNDWDRFFGHYSKVGVRTIHLVRVRLRLTSAVLSTIETLQLSYAAGESLRLHEISNLKALDIPLGGAGGKSFKSADYTLCKIPLTLERLQLDSGCSAYLERQICRHNVPRLLSPLIFTQLTSLQLPLALLFENPNAMAKKTVTAIFPASLSSLVLQEVWPRGVVVGKYSSYGHKMASSLD